MVFSIIGLDKLKIDDPVGAISVHGVCGFFGLMVVPLSNADATFGAQLLGAAVIFAWVFGASLVVWGVLKATMGIRVSEEEEMEGMDMHDCGVGAYPEFVTVK
ncbi:ammonium transporter [Vibrio cholerae]|nr:ammonium transporter [Vibrio cholerae]